MAPTILVIGATGNTGKNVIRQLPKLLESSTTPYRILGLTRSLDNPASQKLAKLPKVEMQEKDWATIDTAWLQSQDVVRVYIAPHNLPSQFVDESALHIALLHAGVKYVVRVSTNVEYVSPTNPVYYGRSHWAIENLLSQPEFESLQWTSLQPNFFTASYLDSAADWIKSYQKTGKQDTLSMNPAENVAVAMIDPEDVGNVGAHLLALEDPSPHNHAKYVLSGPEDVTGKGIVELVEKYVGVKVQKAEFKATSWIGDLVKAGVYPEKVLPSILAGCEPLWEGRCSLAGTPTSGAVMKLAPPRRTVEDALKTMLE
ncbi:related to NmrA-like family protein [Phialocephala subalpina]|uniref:Related to NmrA-like family protein n=1 Tax=Phialocephala subalpina TaxID=576137 RepID=A0A1L7XNB3_9HELO|nr:related to NmrA-like family protein [Phialocephala subalpina]